MDNKNRCKAFRTTKILNKEIPYFTPTTRYFVQFLLTKQRYHKFVFNIYNQTYIKLVSTLRTEPIESSEDLLMKAFLWRETKEGHDFWSTMHSEYKVLHNSLVENDLHRPNKSIMFKRANYNLTLFNLAI